MEHEAEVVFVHEVVWHFNHNFLDESAVQSFDGPANIFDVHEMINIFLVCILGCVMEDEWVGFVVGEETVVLFDLSGV